MTTKEINQLLYTLTETIDRGHFSVSEFKDVVDQIILQNTTGHVRSRIYRNEKRLFRPQQYTVELHIFKDEDAYIVRKLMFKELKHVIVPVQPNK